MVLARGLLRALRFAALFVLLCAVKLFALEVLYGIAGFFDLFRDEVRLCLLDGALGAAQKIDGLDRGPCSRTWQSRRRSTRGVEPLV